MLSDIKLAVEQADGNEPVTILQRLGTADERIVETTWAELDRTVEADHLTCVYVPRLAHPVADHYVRFHELARTLRERCPWDREQTHKSLAPYLVEEAFELVDALEALDPDDPTTDTHVIEELGDLLYHVEFHAAIAEQDGRFSIVDIVDGVHDKLVRRHPHVFGDVEAHDAETVEANWDDIKRDEKQRSSVFDGVATLAAGARLRPAAAAQGGQGRLRLGRSERPAGQDRRGARRGTRRIDAGDEDTVAGELGDLLFAVVNTARHAGVDAELALRRAAAKFRRRSRRWRRSRDRGVELAGAGLATLDALWEGSRQPSSAPNWKSVVRTHTLSVRSGDAQKKKKKKKKKARPPIVTLTAAAIAVLAASSSIAAAPAPPPSPTTGHAAVVAQANIEFTDGSYQWRVSAEALDSTAAPAPAAAGADTFIAVTDGALVAADAATPIASLAAGEALFVPVDATTTISALTGVATTYSRIALVAGGTGGAGDPFTPVLSSTTSTSSATFSTRRARWRSPGATPRRLSCSSLPAA